MLDFLTYKPLLRAGRFGQFAITKQLGAGIDFVWPCSNLGDADGAALIKITEGGAALWDGPPFVVSPSETVNTSLHQTIALSLGLHPLVAELHEQLPLGGDQLLQANTVALTVVSTPVLAPVGLPRINGIDGPALITVPRGTPIAVSWPCQNSGGGAGQARLAVTPLPTLDGSLITIPGFSTVTLLLTYGASVIFPVTRTQTITMKDAAGTVLGTWTFSYQTS